MNGEEENFESRETARRSTKRRHGHGPRVGEVRRKPRYQGPLGWLRKRAYSQRSPLITIAVLLVGIALTGGILWVMTRTQPSLPAEFADPPK